MVLIFRKDVRLPIQLQRAMAAEAEAARESRAKVITNNDYESDAPNDNDISNDLYSDTDVTNENNITNDESSNPPNSKGTGADTIMTFRMTQHP